MSTATPKRVSAGGRLLTGLVCLVLLLFGLWSAEGLHHYLGNLLALVMAIRLVLLIRG